MTGNGPSLKEILSDSPLMQKIDKLHFAKNGLLRDITFRTLNSSSLVWWTKDTSDWKLCLEHSSSSEVPYTYDYWINRVLNLCERKETREFFGLGFKELMHMDPSTFEVIEKRVYKLIERLNAAMPKEVKDLAHKDKKFKTGMPSSVSKKGKRNAS